MILINSKARQRITVAYAFESLSLLHHLFLWASAQFSPLAGDSLAVLTKLQSFFDFHERSWKPIPVFQQVFELQPSELRGKLGGILTEVKLTPPQFFGSYQGPVSFTLVKVYPVWRQDDDLPIDTVWYQDSVIKAMALWQYYTNLLSSLAGKNQMVKHSSIHHTFSYYTKYS